MGSPWQATLNLVLPWLISAKSKLAAAPANVPSAVASRWTCLKESREVQLPKLSTFRPR